MSLMLKSAITSAAVLLVAGTLYKRRVLSPHGTFFGAVIAAITSILFKQKRLQAITRWHAGDSSSRCDDSVPRIELFPSIADPHTYVLLQAIQSTVRNFKCEVQIFAVSPRRARYQLEGLSTFERFQQAANDRLRLEGVDNTDSGKFYEQPTSWGIEDGHSTSANNQYEWGVLDAKLSAKVHGLRAFVPPPLQVRSKLEYVADAALLCCLHQYGRGWNPVLNATETIEFCVEALHIADMLSKEDESGLFAAAAAIGTRGAQFEGSARELSEEPATSVFNANHEHLGKKRKHYLPGMLYYSSEFYWGTDRLNFLEQRLFSMGCATNNSNNNSNNMDPTAAPLKWRNQYELECQSSVVYPTTFTNLSPSLLSGHDDPDNCLVMYYSFRSPYSQIAVARFFAIARHHRVPCMVRPLLPMVMRPNPLAVPRVKSMYIMMDTSREGHRVGYTGIGMCDPVGPGTIRAFAVWHSVVAPQKNVNVEESFLRSFSTHVWSNGVDFASDAGAKVVCEGAGLSWSQCLCAMKPSGLGVRQHWQEKESSDRELCAKSGLWGVPSFTFKSASMWGQDRMKALEMTILEDQRFRVVAPKM